MLSSALSPDVRLNFQARLHAPTRASLLISVRSEDVEVNKTNPLLRFLALLRSYMYRAMFENDRRYIMYTHTHTYE